MATATPAHNPSLGGSTTVVTSDGDDETDSYADATPPALVSPQTYNLNLIGGSVAIGKPRLVAERFGKVGGGDGARLWFPDIVSFGLSGNLWCQALLSADSSENHLDGALVFRSSDFGFTWSADDRYDIPYYRSSGGEPRWYENGKIHELRSYMRADPIGQARDFKCDLSYYANVGGKVVRYPCAAHIRGLPQDVQTFTPTQFVGIQPRNCTHLIFSQSDVVRLSDNSLIWSLYVYYVGDSYASQVVVRSTDEGLTWNYLSTVGSDETGLNEATMIRLANGRVAFMARCNGPTSPETDHTRYSTSTDNGATWSSPAIPQSVNGQGAAGIVGSSPTMRQLTNGCIVVAHGNPSHYISVCKDGGAGGAGAGGASAWQRLNITDHHNLYAECGTVANDNLSAGKIRYFRGQDHFYTTGYLALERTGPNRITVCYDYCPSGRNTIGTTTSEPHQIYVMDLDVT